MTYDAELDKAISFFARELGIVALPGSGGPALMPVWDGTQYRWGEAGPVRGTIHAQFLDVKAGDILHRDALHVYITKGAETFANMKFVGDP